MGHLIGKFEIRDSEAGNFIDCFKFLDEAQEEIKRMEKVDKKDRCFTENFYEIYDNEKKEIIK